MAPSAGAVGPLDTSVWLLEREETYRTRIRAQPHPGWAQLLRSAHRLALPGAD